MGIFTAILVNLYKNTIGTISFFNQVDRDLYPEKNLPVHARKLREFFWRGDDKITSKLDIFRPEELAEDKNKN